MHPGLYLDLPAEQYHATQAMSAGGLKRMLQSPAHFYGVQMDPNRPPAGEPTPAMANGTLVHCAIFEPDQVDARYVIKPDGMNFSTKDGKAWRDAQTKIIVDAAQMAAAHAQAKSIRALKDVGPLLAEGFGESSAFWLDDVTGQLCKCRPDWICPVGDDGVVIVDGKTGIDVSPAGFAKAVINFSYDLQAVHYSDGFERTTGKKVHGFVFACCESAWPHQAASYMLPDDWLEAAARTRRSLIDEYDQCMRSGIWPGYSQSIELLERPRWARAA